ncbi:acyl-CoA dehydrogenase family protein [Halalkalibacillus halophilus]|uniref:acyl-CoA dehydrogenase family protein n=1 Tax=Halalkalibacillus halophilus TaxID=392827 RepID=UPI0004122BBB|nr:acyl-CoA dehydrogenase family protein [Halalkalibacillus halophilus]
MTSSLFIRNEREGKLVDRAKMIAQAIQPYAAIGDKQAQLPQEIIQILKDYQYTTLTLEEDLGGEGASLYEWLLMQEQIAIADGSTALSIGWHLGVMLELRDHQVWEKDRYDYLSNEVSKHKLVNRLTTEPNSGSPSRGAVPETTAEKQGDIYVVDGRKTFSTLAAHLDYGIVSVYFTEEDRVGTLLIDLQSEGVSVEKTWDTLGMRGTGSDDVIFHQVHVPINHLVELQGVKKSVPKSWLLHIPTCYLGIAQAAYQDALTFAQEFVPGSLNKPIAEVSHIQEKLGEMKFLIMRSRHLLYDVALRATKNEGPINEALQTVKISITKDAQQVAELAMQIAGGRSLSNHLPFEKYYRDVRAGLHNPPIEEVVLENFAKADLNNS